MEEDRIHPFDKDDSRLRILYLYQMLQKYTDETHALSTRQIMELMETEHGITMHRTTLPKDVEVLRAAGIEVMSERKRTIYYYLSDRPLSLPELRLLIDAVLSSKFITEKKSRELVEKLISLTSETSADKLRRTVHVTGKAKSDNEKGYYIVDAINDAFHLGKKISFYYFDYDGKKKHVLRNQGSPYTVSPYDLVWDYNKVVDKISDAKALRVFKAAMLLLATIGSGQSMKKSKGSRGIQATQKTLYDCFCGAIGKESLEEYLKSLCSDRNSKCSVIMCSNQRGCLRVSAKTF